MPQLHAYLAFDGTCKEAMKFYERLFGGKLEALITYGDMPMGDNPVPASHKDRIMHANLVHKDFSLMAGDVPPGVPFDGMQGIMLALMYPSADEGTRVFNALAEGGTVHEEGPPERIFKDPESERTRAFLKRIIEAGRL